MDCLLPEVFAAMRGEAPSHLAMVMPPPGIPSGPGRFSRGAAPPPPGTSKPTYGTDLAYHVDGADFTVQWTDPGVDPARARAILDQLEGGWQHLIVEDGWPAPVSSDAWRLWVVLDSTVPGSGYTTLYTSGDYPDGYPVSFLNPDYAKDQDVRYALSVAVHEFGHMIQYAVRDWRHDDAEAWYWEASAEWVAERGAPEIDTYAWSTYWYALAPDDRYDSQVNGHAYGMLIVDSYLEQYVVGPLGIRDIWGGAGASSWHDVLADAAGTSFGELIRDVTGAYAAHALRESDLFYDPVLLDEDLDEVGERKLAAPEPYGTYYLTVASLPDGATFWTDGSIFAAYAVEGTWSDVPPESGPFTVTMTEYAKGGSMAYGIGERWDDTPGGDTAADTGDGPDGKAQACGCASGGSGGAGGVAWMGVWVWVVVRGRCLGARRWGW